MKKTRYKVLAGILIILTILVAAFIWYVNDDYDATDIAQAALVSSEKVEVTDGNPVQLVPKEESQSETGIIFYPGGKVEADAYAPLMQALAGEGYATFLVEMPFGLAVFDVEAAAQIITDNPNVTNWFIAGHSLGGSMAALFAEKNLPDLSGLIMLAAYSTVDLSQTELSVLSIYGSEDQVIDAEKVDEFRPMLPENSAEIVIEGGNHAQFGSYGPQEGDGEAAITPESQHQQTVEAIKEFIESGQ